MNALDTLLASILANPLAPSRAAQAPVAYVGFDFPLELVLCGERHFSHLPWQLGRATPDADKWLESSFATWARSMLQDWFDGEFTHFDSVVFTRGDDNAQRLYYYICELQRLGQLGGPRPLILDVALIQRDSSIEHNRYSLQTLLTQLGISTEALDSGRQHANAARAIFDSLDGERNLPGHFHEQVARASLFANLVAALEKGVATNTNPARRVLLAGSSPPNDCFHLAVEAVGWNVVGDCYQRSLRRFGNNTATDCDALTAIATHMNHNRYGPRTFSDRSTTLLQDLRHARAEAVVLWLAEEDEALAWNVASQRQLLSAHKIPTLILTRRRWDTTDGAADAIRQFLQELPR